MSRRGLGPARVVVALLCAAILGMLVPSGASASTLPAGFEETTVLPGVGKPQDIAIAPNGRVFVAEKTGFIRTYDSVDDTTPTLFADLRVQVHNYGSRGLLSIVVGPRASRPSRTCTSTTRWTLRSAAPRRCTAAAPSTRARSTPDGPTYGQLDNCPVGSRISRLQVAGRGHDRHREGAGRRTSASSSRATRGGGLALRQGRQALSRRPATARPRSSGTTGRRVRRRTRATTRAGRNPTPPTSEAGRLRAQDVRTTGDPTGLSGSLIRIDPATGAPARHQRRRRERQAHRRLRPPRRHAPRGPARHERHLGGGPRRRVLGGVPPRDAGPRRKPNFGWPCYENNAIARAERRCRT